MSVDLVLKPQCCTCGSTADLYGSTCKHLTLCLSCGKSMAETHAKCNECGAVVTRLIREYKFRTCPSSNKKYFVGKFSAGVPNFKKDKNKWSLQKEGPQGRQIMDTLWEKYKNKPWLLEDEKGEFHYRGQLEGSQLATYYLLMLQGKEFVAHPAGSWYNFNKAAHYKQLTLEEAEEKMKIRRKIADAYPRWMTKAANNGAAAFSAVGKNGHESAASGGRGHKKSDDEGNVSDKDEEEDGPRGGDLEYDDDDDDTEKGDDWEHDERFTDDDEAVGNDSEEQEDLAPELPAPQQFKQDDEDEDEAEEDEGGLSKSGREMRKLLGRSSWLNDSDTEDDDSEDTVLLALAQKEDALKQEPVDISP